MALQTLKTPRRDDEEQRSRSPFYFSDIADSMPRRLLNARFTLMPSRAISHAPDIFAAPRSPACTRKRGSVKTQNAE